MAILLIHTGGTIGMAETATGFAPKKGVVENFVRRSARRGALSQRVDICSLAPLIDSANAAPADWDRIARPVADSHDVYDAFVITHGTDTLAFTAAALCFALQGLARPVLLTGAMLPLTVAGNDGSENLLQALNTAAATPAGVWVRFAGRLLHGARVRKTHSKAFDAFAASPSAFAPRQSGDAVRLHRVGVNSASVAVLALAPGVADGLLAYAAAHCDGLILRCYGSGTAPETRGLRAALGTALQRAVPVVAVSQCPEGGMALGTYAAAAILRDNGVIDGRDMTVEAAYTKVIYTLAYSDDRGVRRERLASCICGEFTP